MHLSRKNKKFCQAIDKQSRLAIISPSEQLLSDTILLERSRLVTGGVSIYAARLAPLPPRGAFCAARLTASRPASRPSTALPSTTRVCTRLRNPATSLRRSSFRQSPAYPISGGGIAISREQGSPSMALSTTNEGGGAAIAAACEGVASELSKTRPVTA